MRLNKVIRQLVIVCALAAPVFAAVPLGCKGNTSLGTFRISVLPVKGGTPLPIKSANSITTGESLEYEPLHLSVRSPQKARVAVVLLPPGDKGLVVLEAKPANARATWKVPENPSVLALIFGPQGLNVGKVKSMVEHNQQLLTQLADYAEQTSQVEALVQALADSEQSGSGADAALKGFSASYGVSLPKLDSKAPTDQQAAVLLQALMPSLSTYDPLAPRTALMQQSAGIAASLAGLFFGSPVGLAAGGAALFQNLQTLMFPGTEFRSAFAQNAGTGDLALCSKIQPAKSRTRLAYLWAYRVPNVKEPKVALAGPANVPLGSKSLLKLSTAGGTSVKNLAGAREWKLVPLAGGTAISVPVTIASTPDTIELDLSKIKVAPGEYRLDASWDWSTLSVTGSINLRPYDNFREAQLTAESRDKLIEGSGTVTVTLNATDFEFVERAAVENAGKRSDNPTEVAFKLPLGKRGGPQNAMTVEVSTAKRGDYRLLLTQSDRLTHEVPYTVLPPNPKLESLPVHANVGETSETIELRGSGLDRIEAVKCDAGEITGVVKGNVWAGTIALKPDAKPGTTFPLQLSVKGLDTPVTVNNALEVVGPRLQISDVRESMPADLGIELHRDELPVGTTIGLVFSIQNFPARPDVRPTLRLGCNGGTARQALAIAPGDQSKFAKLNFAGSSALYLSFDPGDIGFPGCRLTAAVTVDPEGSSDAKVLGNVIRIPRLDQFTLTDEKSGDSAYIGILKGRDLDTIDKVGWDPDHGVPVESIPAPVPGQAQEQTLRVAMPWPAPAPHAPVYLWLRGESAGRATSVKY